MKIAVIGLGSIGQRHVGNLLTLYPAQEIMGYDLKPTTETRIPVTQDFAAILAWQPTHALIATPPNTHWAMTDALLREGVHCFVEKPLALTESAGRLLVDMADKSGLILAVGYQLRAHKSLETVWRQWDRLTIWDRQDWLSWPRPTYERQLLEEFSHELDLALWLAGGRQQIVRGTVIKTETQAEIHLTCRDNGPIEIHLNARFNGYERGLEMINGPEFLTWIFDKQENQRAYRDEVRQFLLGTPYCTGRDGVAVLSLLEGWHAVTT